MTLAGEMETYGGFSEHPYEEEIAYVLSGEVTILFPEESFVLREEDTIRILPGRKHRFRNNLKETAKVLFVKCKVERLSLIHILESMFSGEARPGNHLCLPLPLLLRQFPKL